MLVVDRLVKHYPTGGGEVVRALDGVTLEVMAGELVALYGPSGSGKTTLLEVVAALRAPDSGRVIVGDRDVAGLSVREAQRYRRLDLGYVSQSVDLLPGVKAIDNAALKLLGTRANVREARDAVAPLLERLGLGDRLEHRPDELSAGQRQRVLIARALSTSPRLLLADEPTGSLDTRRGREVLDLLAGLCDELSIAMLLVTHDPQAAVHASRVHELEDGRLSARPPAAPVRLGDDGR